jgi:hypothetical protein
MNLNTKGTDFNVSQVTFNTRVVRGGGGSVGIRINGMSLILETPTMLTQGAIGDAMKLEFSSADAHSAAFLNNMEMFENHIKDSAVEYAKEWFGKSLNWEEVDARFTPMLRYPKDKAGYSDLTKDPTLNVEIPKQCQIYDTDRVMLFSSATNTNLTLSDLLKKESMVKCLIQCDKIWFENGHFGVDWKLVQAVVMKQQMKPEQIMQQKLKQHEPELKQHEPELKQHEPITPQEMTMREGMMMLGGAILGGFGLMASGML